METVWFRCKAGGEGEQCGGGSVKGFLFWWQCGDAGGLSGGADEKRGGCG